MKKNTDLLKEVLSVPTKTYQEEKMVEFLVNWLTENNISHFVDEHNNVYATKQESTELPEDFYFPCVISHTDTVHNIDTINISEEMLPNAQREIKLSYKAYNDQGKPTGIGGDDKCGVFACLTLLQELPYLKAAFFVSEETGCHGSLKASEDFFSNVGYGIQFDAPENWMITEKCFGQVLFDRETEFFETCDKVLTEGMNQNDMQYMVHPYTDVYALRGKFDFSCINISIGYYNYHTKNEYVVVEDVFNGINMGRKMIENLGNKLHYKKSVSYDWRTRSVF
jgi:putative aminopeptidase FrvX